MYYVFYVNDGYTIPLDLPPAGFFRDLHYELTQKTGVEARDQIFFLSNGEALIGDYSLSEYADVGTETNPIYFIKRISTEKDPINSREEEGITNLFENWKTNVDQLNNLAPKLQLVSNYCDAVIRYCAKIVSEHQYLNHGWIAVTRNLDENFANLSARYAKVNKISQRLPLIRKHAQIWVANFDVVFDALSKIKIPGSLLTTSQSGCSSDLDSNAAESPCESITLLDWIERQDPVHTLDSLIEHVSQHVEKLNDNDVVRAQEALTIVKDLIKRKDYREIKGIDKRLAMLDAKLIELENAFGKLKESSQKLLSAQADQNTFRIVIADQRERINSLSSSLEEFTRHAFLFLNSKIELLKNVRQRLAGWIRQSYDRLQIAQTNVTLFEEKFSGFKQRLDLVRQIREAPIIFVAAVSEVIRRNAFQAEFNEWSASFIQKCSEFIKDENMTRAEFYCKLEKHFLRDIFKNMGDELPNFCPPKVKFDTKLPMVSDDLLRELRESLKDCANMEGCFTIVYPQVFNCLTVTPKSGQQSESREQQAFIHREESFFVKDMPTNPMRSSFPSSTWLNGAADEHAETSQSPITAQFFMSKAGGSTTSFSAETTATTPSDLVPNLESIQSTGLIPCSTMFNTAVKSSSVDLNSAASIHPEHFKFKSDKDPVDQDSTPPQESRPSFQGGITESETSLAVDSSTSPRSPMLSLDTEESQQTCTFQTSSVNGNEFLKELKLNLTEITEEFKHLNLDVNEYQSQTGKLLEDNLNRLKDEASNRLKATHEALNDQIQTNNHLEERLIENENRMVELQKELEQLGDEDKKLREIIEHERYLRIEKEKEVLNLNETNTKLNGDLLNTIQDKNQLQLELINSESERKKLEERLETDSNSADCLSIELDILGQILKRDLKTDEIEWIRNEIEKRKIVKKPDQEAKTHQEHASTSRAEYENVLRKKMNLLAQGMETQKNEEIARLRDIIETETKEEHARYVRRLKERIGELKDKLNFYENIGPVASSTISPTSPVSQGMISSLMSAAMQESCQIIRKEEEKTSDQNEIAEMEEKTTDDSQDLVTASKNSIGIQTKLRKQDLHTMIFLSEISEGSAIILFFNETHNSYCVFSTSKLLYFVKQRSLRSMGIEQNTRPSKNVLIFARVTSVELCETKKEPNRYHLPANTRFYRVDVSPMPLDGSNLPFCVLKAAESSSSSKTV